MDAAFVEEKVHDITSHLMTYVDAPHAGVEPDVNGKYTYDGRVYCSLYARYNLTSDDIKIIEAIIKARK